MKRAIQKRMFYLLIHLGILWMLLATSLAAATSLIYVANKGGTTVSVIDSATDKVVQTIEGIEAPEGARFSPDGSRIYVTSSEQFLNVLDRKTGKIIKRVPISGHANNLAVTRDGKLAVVCIARPGAVDFIDLTSLEKVKTIPMRSMQHNVILTGDGRYAITGSPAGKFAAFFDLRTMQLDGEMNFDEGVGPLAIESNPDGSGRRLFLNLSETNGFAVVDFAKRQEVTRIKVPEEPVIKVNGSPSHGLEIAPDQKTIWATSRPNNAVYVYSLADLKLMGRVQLPDLKQPEGGKPPTVAWPYWVTFTHDSSKVYIANNRIGSVTAIDANTMKVVAVIPTGENPDRISTLVLP